MNEDKFENLNQADLEDASWSNFLSSAASEGQPQSINDDEAVISRTLGFLKRERNESPAFDQIGDPVWAARLSSAAQLRAIDHDATKVILAGLQRERSRSRRAHVIQLGTRWLAGTGLVAAVIAGVLLRAPASASVDPNEAYQAYQEASEGW
jgi:hypothetical protein